jgi:hypothetical protein
MMELTWRGSKPLKMNDGSERKFLADGDTVIMRGHGEKDPGCASASAKCGGKSFQRCNSLSIVDCPMPYVRCLMLDSG